MSRGLGEVYKRQVCTFVLILFNLITVTNPLLFLNLFTPGAPANIFVKFEFELNASPKRASAFVIGGVNFCN